MKVFRKLCREKTPTAIALGYFDGVHVGHEKVIMKAVSYKKQGLKPIILTFDESPRVVLKGFNERKLMSQECKINVFCNMGIESLYIIDFLTLKDMSAQFFVQKVLSDILNVRQAVCGFNYTFGDGGKSSASDLKALGYFSNINVDIIQPVKYKDEVVSSTRIRKAISDNDVLSIKEMTKYIYK